MTGVITSLPPVIQQPPGNNSSNPAGLPGLTYTPAVPTLPQTWTGLQTFQPGSMQFAGSTSGFTFLNASPIASGIADLPALTGTDILLANNNVAVVTNKSIDGLTNTLTNIPTGALDADLQAIAALTGTGILARTAANTWALRTDTGTANEITVTNGDGVAGNPTVSLPSALTFTGKTVTGGTFNSPALVTPALGTPASGVATNLTGTAAGLTAGNATLAATVTTNANLTGPVTSVGNATTIGANQVTRANEAQGVARSVIGVTGNATANVADIQGTASQFLGINSAGTALAFQTMTTDVTLSGPAATISANAITNAKMAQAVAFTLKGNATGSTANLTDIDVTALTVKSTPVAADLLLIHDSAASFAFKKATVGTVAAAGSVASFNGLTGAVTLFPVGTQNYTLVESHAGNAATYSLKTLAGIDATASTPIYVNTSDGTTAVITGALSVTLNSTAVHGSVSGVPFRLWFAIFNNAGTLLLGVRNCTSSTGISGFGGQGYASTANDNASVQVTWTSGTVLTSKQHTVIGYADYDSGMATAGTWITSPTRIQLFGPQIPLPGTVVQEIYFVNSSNTTTTSSTLTATGLTKAIIPNAVCNPIAINVIGGIFTSNAAVSGVTSRLTRGASSIGTTMNGGGGSSGSQNSPNVSCVAFDRPATTASTTYTVKVANGDNATSVEWNHNGIECDMIIRELMG
jgi:hypothetical protein